MSYAILLLVELFDKARRELTKKKNQSKPSRAAFANLSPANSVRSLRLPDLPTSGRKSEVPSPYYGIDRIPNLPE